MHLHGYWRSSAAYRVRIGLHLKGLAFTQTSVNLLGGEQTSAAYRAINPQGLVPFLTDGEVGLGQSLAILEWLEETHPFPPLLPTNAQPRAIVRSMAALMASEMHPLGNTRVIAYLRANAGFSDDQVAAWVRNWLATGLDGLEPMLERHAGQYAYGDNPGLADCLLVPVGYGCERWSLDLAPYPTAARIIADARQHPAFIAAHPDNQPDKPAV